MLNIGSILGDGLSLDENKKQAVRDYQYLVDDQSSFAPFMYKIWSIFFMLVPKRISPNLVTVFGLSTILLAFIYIQLNTTDDDYWNCLLFGIALFIYQAADAMDGMQGKRVHMYHNATTEIFDHGVDSIVTSLASITTITRLTHIDQRLSPIYSVLVLITSFIGFYSPTYEHVVTGKMRFQAGPCNPTEALLGMQLIYFITALYPSMWFHEKSKVLLIITVSVLFISSIFCFLSSLKQIYLHQEKNWTATLKSSFRGYFPLFVVIISAFLLLHHIPTFYREHSLICLLAMAIPWNYSVYRTIIIIITDDKHFDTLGIFIGQSPILLPLFAAYFFPSSLWSSLIMSIVFSGIVYIYTIHFTLREVCHALSMKHFWTVKNDSQTEKQH